MGKSFYQSRASSKGSSPNTRPREMDMWPVSTARTEPRGSWCTGCWCPGFCIFVSCVMRHACVLTETLSMSDIYLYYFFPVLTGHFCYCLVAKSWALWTVACQVPLSMGFPMQEYWSRLPFPPPGNLPNSGINPTSPPLHADSSSLSNCGSPHTLLLIPNPTITAKEKNSKRKKKRFTSYRNKYKYYCGLCVRNYVSQKVMSSKKMLWKQPKTMIWSSTFSKSIF